MAKNLTMHPAPVYVATFSDGTVARMSYWQPMNKPLRQEAARGMVCQAIGNERFAESGFDFTWHIERVPESERTETQRARDNLPIGMRGNLRRRGILRWRQSVAPAADIIAGHTERKDTGEIVPDPFFEESTVAPLAKPARKPATKAQLDRAVALLAELESRFGSQFPQAFGDAQEFLLERMAA